MLRIEFGTDGVISPNNFTVPLQHGMINHHMCATYIFFPTHINFCGKTASILKCSCSVHEWWLVNRIHMQFSPSLANCGPILGSLAIKEPAQCTLHPCVFHLTSKWTVPYSIACYQAFLQEPELFINRCSSTLQLMIRLVFEQRGC